MSCSLYRWTEKCDGRPCAGDCDFCDYFPDEDEKEIKETKYEIHGRKQKSNSK